METTLLRRMGNWAREGSLAVLVAVAVTASPLARADQASDHAKNVETAKNILAMKADASSPMALAAAMSAPVGMYGMMAAPILGSGVGLVAGLLAAGIGLSLFMGGILYADSLDRPAKEAEQKFRKQVGDAEADLAFLEARPPSSQPASGIGVRRTDTTRPAPVAGRGTGWTPSGVGTAR